MFIDFNRVFKDKPQTEIALPKTLISYMNKQLPKGVKYVIQDGGICMIMGDDAPMNIGGFSLKLTKEQERILGEHYSEDDLMSYLYNSQKAIPLELKKEGVILINGEEFPIEKMVVSPMDPIQYQDGKMCLIPISFGETFKLTVGCEKYTEELIVSRMPNESIHIAKFESKKDDPLYLQYQIDKKNETFKANISYNLKYAKTIKDVVKSVSIYNAFLKGNGYLEGQKINTNIFGNEKKMFDEKSIFFWEKVLKIEKYLKVSFTPPRDDVKSDTMCLVETLYQNLINKIPVRDKKVIEAIDGDEGSLITKEETHELLEKPIYLEFETMVKEELFGVELEFPAMVGIFNAMLKKIDCDGKKQKIILEDESEQNRRYTSILRFKSENELDKFKKKDYNQRITLFHDAMKAQNYMK